MGSPSHTTASACALCWTAEVLEPTGGDAAVLAADIGLRPVGARNLNLCERQWLAIDHACTCECGAHRQLAALALDHRHAPLAQVFHHYAASRCPSHLDTLADDQRAHGHNVTFGK